MKRFVVFLFIIAASLIAAGCVGCLESFQPAPTIVPTVAPTALPTATPSATPAPGLKTYEPPNPGLYQYFQNGVRAQWTKTYRADDWTLQKIPGDVNNAHHGAILELNFWNPTSANQTVSYVNILATYTEKLDYPNKIIRSNTAFYDDEHGFFYNFDLAPGEHRTVWLYSLIPDSDFEKYGNYIAVSGLTINYPDLV